MGRLERTQIWSLTTYESMNSTMLGCLEVFMINISVMSSCATHTTPHGFGVRPGCSIEAMMVMMGRDLHGLIVEGHLLEGHLIAGLDVGRHKHLSRSSAFVRRSRKPCGNQARARGEVRWTYPSPIFSISVYSSLGSSLLTSCSVVTSQRVDKGLQLIGVKA